LAAADVVAAADLDFVAANSLPPDGALAVEDVGRTSFDERALFHLLNVAVERRGRLLVTSACGPTAIPTQLIDLASRLRALHPFAITAPDDELLRRVLVKLFADRQLAVDAGVIDYVIARMERSLDAANRIVDWLDRRALAENRPITRIFVGTALSQMMVVEDRAATGDPPGDDVRRGS
jgi:chromosomal replication initiation ATPase DnaA